MPKEIIGPRGDQRPGPVAPSDPDGRLVEIADGKVAVSDEGPADRLPVLCVHGIPGSRRDFRYLAPLLAVRFRVLRVEMPGFGDSPAGAEAHLSLWARVLLALPDALGLDRYALLSHSFGGGALLLAGGRATERLVGLVLLASMGPRRHRAFALAPERYAAVRRLLELRLTRPLVASLGRQSYRRMRLPPPATWQELHRHLSLLASVRFSDLADGARKTRAPALVAHCRDDRLVEIAIARELAATLPRGRLVELESGGHHLQKSRARELATAIENFLTEAEPGS